MRVNEDEGVTLLRSRVRELTLALEAATRSLERATSLTMAEKAEAVGAARDVLQRGGR